VVTDYLEKAGLQKDLDALGFNLVRLRLHHLHRQLRPARPGDLQGDQRQRPGRLLGAVRQPQFRGPGQSGRAANYLASPPLVVAYAIAGT
jgi:aconitate hydratase